MQSQNNVSLVGGKKSNGHKAACRCPICLNMMKKGGNDIDKKTEVNDIIEDIVLEKNANNDDYEKIMDTEITKIEGGKRKHKRGGSTKRKSARRHRKSRRNRRSRRHRR